MKVHGHFSACACLAAVISLPRAQVADTLRLTLTDAESLFVSRSVELMEKKYAVEGGRASIRQAGLWDNPNLSLDQGFYNWQTKRYFDVGSGGESAVAIQQLIVLGGKRSKRIALEKSKSRITELEFSEILRNLKHAVRQNFFALHYLRASLSIYDSEIPFLTDLVRTFRDQYSKGNVALTELSRLEAMLFELEDERGETNADIRDKQDSLKLLLSLPAEECVIPLVDTVRIESLSVQALALSQLIQTASDNRKDVKMVASQVDLNKADLAYQRSLSIPDMTLGASWDRAGSYIDNYNSLTLSFDLPLWNRNQGNIKVSEYQLKASELSAKRAATGLESEVRGAYRDLLETDALYKRWRDPFSRNFDALAAGISSGYRKKNVSLLEFIDFFQSYKESKGRLYGLQNRRINEFENINFVTGSDVFRFD